MTCTNLMGDVWPRLTDVAPHFAHYTDVIVAVEKIELVFALVGAATTAVRGLVCLERGITEDDNHALRVFVCGGDGCMLFGNQLGKLWGRHRLCSCRLHGHVSGGRHVWDGCATGESQAVDILARFLPRSGESREAGLSVVGDSALSGPGIFSNLVAYYKSVQRGGNTHQNKEGVLYT